MARVCTELNVPRPERGYWAKLAVGKAPSKPPLPAPQPGDQLDWAPGEALQTTIPPNVKHQSSAPSASPRSKTHPLVAGAKELFEAGRVSHSGKYLKPNKRLLIDLTVTQPCLEKALSFANDLFLSLAAKSYRVVIASPREPLYRAEVDERETSSKSRGHYNNLWAPMRCTVVYVGTVAIGISIIEMSETLEARYVNGEYVPVRDIKDTGRSKRLRYDGWVTTQEFPTKRLRLQLYSPYSGTEWVRHWDEKTGASLSKQIPKIVGALKKAAGEIAGLAEVARQRAEAEHQRWEAQMREWRRREEERRSAQALKDSTEQLQAIIEAWAHAKSVQAFFEDAESRLAGLPSAEQEELKRRLARAREMMGSVDAVERLRMWRLPEER